MRLNILAFAAGVLGLQMQPALPAWVPLAVGGLLLCLPRLRWSNGIARVMVALGCLALGVAWASWRAEIRLADQLAADWEGRDVEVIGVIAGLPQDFSNGTRFEFDVKTRLTVAVLIESAKPYRQKTSGASPVSPFPPTPEKRIVDTKKGANRLLF